MNNKIYNKKYFSNYRILDIDNTHNKHYNNNIITNKKAEVFKRIDITTK